ncbi:MAG: hypothetical protein AAGE84_10965 [Cyanobacteria bacterium P01_G01_bin.39]
MRLNTSNSMKIAKVAIAFSFFNFVIALTAHHSVIISRVKTDTVDTARNVVKEVIEDIKVLPDVEVRQ